MNSLYFVTTNTGKVISLEERFKEKNVVIEQIKLDLIEPQAFTAKEVSLSKAKQAFEELKKPLVVEDSAFHINALNGFPGPYIKYALETLGAEGILGLINHIEERDAYFESALTYIDSSVQKTFVDKSYKGTITKKVDTSDTTEAWSDLWKIFIPQNSTKTLASLSREERSLIDAKMKRKNNFQKFAEWYSGVYL